MIVRDHPDGRSQRESFAFIQGIWHRQMVVDNQANLIGCRQPKLPFAKRQKFEFRNENGTRETDFEFEILNFQIAAICSAEKSILRIQFAILKFNNRENSNFNRGGDFPVMQAGRAAIDRWPAQRTGVLYGSTGVLVDPPTSLKLTKIETWKSAFASRGTGSNQSMNWRV